MKFVAPEMELKLFSTEDILTASGAAEDELYQPDCPAELPMD
jgi:hypothetical protein